MNLGSIPAGTHMSHWWQPEGHPAKAAPVHQKIPTIRGHVRAFVMRACSTLKASLSFDVSDVPSVCLVHYDFILSVKTTEAINFMCLKRLPLSHPFYFVNNSVKNRTNLITFGIRRPEETGHRRIINLPAHTALHL